MAAAQPQTLFSEADERLGQLFLKIERPEDLTEFDLRWLKKKDR